MSQRAGPSGGAGGAAGAPAGGGLFASRARPRPYTGRARLPPVERAKMRPPQHQQHKQQRWRPEEEVEQLEEENDEGEEERAHAPSERVRHAVDYAPSTRSLGAAARFRGHVEEYDFEPRLRDSGASPSLSAKSCDNIFTRHWGSCAPPLGRQNTRSEEALYAGPPSATKGGHDSSQKMTSARSMGHVSTRHQSGTKARLTALLKKLSPRGLRRSRSQPSTAGDSSGPVQCPWLLVEFSAHDLDGESGCRDSTGSDCSFDLAVSESQRRKEEHMQKKHNIERNISGTSSAAPTVASLEPKLATSKILGASQDSSIDHSLTSALWPTSSVTDSPTRSHSQPVSPMKPKLMPKPVLVRGSGGGAGGGSSGGVGGGGGGTGSRPHAASEEDVRRGGSGAGGARAAVGSPRARGAPAPRPRTAPPPPPAQAQAQAAARPAGPPSPAGVPAIAASAVPSVTMTSLDSIGSCSLDAYASSSEGTDPFTGANKHISDKPKGHSHDQHNIGEQDDELASACTLCSVSALSTPSSPTAPHIIGGGDAVAESTSRTANAHSQSPEYVRKTARLFEGSEKQQEPEESDFLNIPAAKKPSYLGLACSLSGYSGLTSYDSKLREGFRTRDKSPAPPPPRPLTTSNMPKTSPPTVNGIGSGSTTNGIASVSPRSTRGTMDLLNGRILEDKNQQPSGSKEFGTSTLRESSRQFMSTMLSDEVDYSHCTRMLNVAHPHGPSPTTPKDSLNSSNSSHYALKRSPGTVRVVEFTSQSKSYVSAIVSSTSSRTSMQTESTEIHQYTSEVVVGVNGADAQQDTPKSRSSHISRVDSEQTVPVGYCTPKSFVQQRIERLYGPGALAQGFFSRTRQQSVTEEESAPQNLDASGTSSVGSPALPVLRHLRPEFRAQLPLTSSSTIRSPRRIQRELPSSYESPTTPPILQQQTSVESISDSQPAAPEVPVLVGESLPVTNALSTGDALMSPLLCKEVGNSIKHDQPANKSDADLTRGETFPTQPPALDKADLVTIEEEKNGHYFLKVLRSEIQRLSKLVESAENELETNNSLPEEAQGKLRAASGQARLLMKQKLQQFEGLCHKNINQSPDEVFPTTAQDLAGFWDMVKLQVDHVDRLFVELDRLKSSGWVEATNENLGSSVGNSGSSAGARRRTTGRRGTPSSTGGSRSKSGTEDQKKGEGTRKKEELAQARKRMMEEKRRMLKQQQQQTKEQESIEIFVPHENGK